MRTKRPVVWEDVFSHISTLDGGIRVDTLAWVAWLDAPTTTSFAYPIDNAAQGYSEAFMTVRKERRQRGGAYWTAYSPVGGQMRKAYVGRTEAVTDARLRAIAATFLARLLCPPPHAARRPLSRTGAAWWALASARRASRCPRVTTRQGCGAVTAAHAP